MGLFYSKESKQQLLGYDDVGYLSDPHKSRSQTGYVFDSNGTAILWRSFKQKMVATSSNRSKLIAIHEASRECLLLRSMIQQIQESYGLPSIKASPTPLFEDNVTTMHRSKEVISKEIELNTFLQISFIHTNSRRVVKSIFNKYTQMII